ncbi:MAG: iron chaperone [Termitinemataceae bacterium]|nr:MAG: iron chaperone [Termitinemataceae bacterium]
MNTIDDYIATFETDIQQTLGEIRNFIKNEVPDATEKIAYGMPTFYLNGNLVHFAAFKDHYGFFPNPSGIDAFKAELAPYRSGKGTLRFALDKPIPWEIIKKVVQFRVRENAEKFDLRNKAKVKKQK